MTVSCIAETVNMPYSQSSPEEPGSATIKSPRVSEKALCTWPILSGQGPMEYPK